MINVNDETNVVVYKHYGGIISVISTKESLDFINNGIYIIFEY